MTTTAKNNRPWIVAGVLLLLTAWFSTGNHQGDEHFQILEFAAYKLGLASTADLAWEFHDKMRPALQPAMAYLAYRFVGFGGEADPFILGFLLRVLSGGYTLLVAYLLYRRFNGAISGNLLHWFVLALLFHWCAYYSGVRFSSENWSGLTMVLGLLAYPLNTGNDHRRFMPAGGKRAFVAGILFGLAFLFRYQVGLAIVGFGCWLLFIQRETWQRIFGVVAGGVLVILLFYPLTYWLYGEWTSPAWNYLASNLIEGKAAAYGTKPWYGYLELVFLRGIPPLSILYLMGTGIFCWWFRRDPVSWMVIAFVVVHSMLARKDVRFLFPLIPLLPVMVLGAARVIEQSYSPKLWERRWVKNTVKFLWVINLVLLATVVVRPANSGIAPAKFIYDNYPGPAVIGGPNARLLVAEGTVARFYLRPGHVVDTASSEGHCTSPDLVGAQHVCLYVLRQEDGISAPPGGKLVYTSRPDWLEPLNLFGWMDRQRWYFIYALR